VNIIALKITSILSRIEIDRISVLTVDGSPHCLHLHHSVEEAMKVTGKAPEVDHMVVHHGRIIQISKRAIKLSRYLSRLDALLNGRGG